MRYAMLSPGKLKEYEKEILRDAGILCQYRRGQYIFRPGDDVSKLFLIESGTVRLSRLAAYSGREVVSFRRKGDLIGLEDVFLGYKTTRAARAESDASVVAVERDELMEILNCDPFLLSSIIHILPPQTGSFRARFTGREARLSPR